MATEAHRAGITPYLLRLAAYYCCLGVGEYQPKGYANFNRVVVRELLPWSPAESPTQSRVVLIVEFFQNERRIRYVEFAITPDGFGGEPIASVVE